MIRQICTVILCTVLLSHGYLHAQPIPGKEQPRRSSKPLLFSSLPDSFACSNTELNRLISAPENELLTVQLATGFQVNGKIEHKRQAAPGTISVNIRLQNYDNALFNVSLRLMADNSTLIAGRIVHPKYQDVLLLSQQKGKYIFRKNDQRYVMPE